MASEFKLMRRVEFSETDMAGIMHFSNFFRYMEAAEHAFIRSLGLSVVPKGYDPPIGWPRVNATCEYKRPLKYDDNVEIELKVSTKTEKAVTYTCTFRKEGEKEICAIGTITVVCVSIRDGKMQATFIPKEYADKLDVAN